MSEFDDVGNFHEKFKLERVPPVNDYKTARPSPHHISRELQDFRLKFLHEELNELKDGYVEQDLAKIADALVDLVYVALGTAHLHGLPWPALWREVQRANMTKERCLLNHPFVSFLSTVARGQTFTATEGAEDRCYQPTHEGICGQPDVKHSKRGSENDVIKPRGWTPPNVEGVLRCADQARPEVHFINYAGQEICACSHEHYARGAHKGETK